MLNGNKYITNKMKLLTFRTQKPYLYVQPYSRKTYMYVFLVFTRLEARIANVGPWLSVILDTRPFRSFI